jgi:hypothetical protein
MIVGNLGLSQKSQHHRSIIPSWFEIICFLAFPIDTAKNWGIQHVFSTSNLRMPYNHDNILNVDGSILVLMLNQVSSDIAHFFASREGGNGNKQLESIAALLTGSIFIFSG